MNLLGLLTAGTCFGLWPLIMKKSGFNGIQSSLNLTLPTTAIILLVWITGIAGGWVMNTLLVLSLSTGLAAGMGWIALSPHSIAILAGLLNGLGSIKFLEALSATPEEKVSVAILVVVLTQIVMNEVGGVAILGTVVSLRKAIGFVMAVGAVYAIVAK